MDRVLQFVSVLGTAVPPFIIAIALVFTLRHPVAHLPGHRLRLPGRSFSGWIAPSRCR